MQLTLHPVGGYWFVAMIAAVLLVVLARVAPRHIEVPFGKLLTLKGLRLLAILLLLFALLRPTLQFTRTTPEEATLLVLADISRSMQVEDSLDNRSRFDAVKLVLGDSDDFFRKLSTNWNVRAYSFGDSLESVEYDDGQFKLPDQPTGEQSALGAALEELLEREGDEQERRAPDEGDGCEE